MEAKITSKTAHLSENHTQHLSPSRSAAHAAQLFNRFPVAQHPGYFQLCFIVLQITFLGTPTHKVSSNYY